MPCCGYEYAAEKWPAGEYGVCRICSSLGRWGASRVCLSCRGAWVARARNYGELYDMLMERQGYSARHRTPATCLSCHSPASWMYVRLKPDRETAGDIDDLCLICRKCDSRRKADRQKASKGRVIEDKIAEWNSRMERLEHG